MYFPIGTNNAPQKSAMKDSFVKKEDDKDLLSSLINKSDVKPITPEEKSAPEEQIPYSLLNVFMELVQRVKGSLAGMKTFAFLSKDKFNDAELGEDFYQIVSEDIEKTISLLNCFQDYINFNTPMKKMNTVNNIIEEILKNMEDQIQEKKIKIIKKQFEKNLPETIVPDEQLRYVLNSIIQYMVHSTRPYGSIGFLTQQFEPQESMNGDLGLLQKDGKYIEVQIASMGDKQRELLDLVPGMTADQGEGGVDLILQLVKEIVQRNKGALTFKINSQQSMSFLSVILPMERRKVVHYLSTEERMKRSKLAEQEPSKKP
jgi:nitrogen-specific signal transduction histidine kinase